MLRYLMLGLLLVSTALHAEVYRWTDDQGVVHFSDKSHQGAEKVDVPPIQVVPAYKPAQAATPATTPGATRGDPNRYMNVRIVSPNDGATVRNNNGNITVSLSAVVGKTPGDHFRLVLDGREIATDHQGSSAGLSNVPRGTHNIGVRIYDGRGQLLKEIPSITVYLHRKGTESKPNTPADPNHPYAPTDSSGAYTPSDSSGAYTPGGDTYKGKTTPSTSGGSSYKPNTNTYKAIPGN